jgi:two-component system cell cycle sensor histidine kinase/response regulator CckA
MPAKTVLIVDDEAEVLDLIAEMIGTAGHSVFRAQTPEQALFVLSGGVPIALLVTDVLMPEMTGYELARRANGLNPDLKVLFVSGYEGEENTMDGDGRQRRTLKKPFRTSQILSEINALLGTSPV